MMVIGNTNIPIPKLSSHYYFKPSREVKLIRIDDIRNVKSANSVVAHPSFYSHCIQIGHCAPLLRKRPRDTVAIESPEASDAQSDLG